MGTLTIIGLMSRSAPLISHWSSPSVGFFSPPGTAEPRNSCHGFIGHQLYNFLVSQPEQLMQNVVVVLADFRARPRGSGRRPRETHPRSLDRETTQPRMIQHNNVAASFELGVGEYVGAGRKAVNRYVNALQDFFERTGLKADRP